MNLLSIERQRYDNTMANGDSTSYANDGEDLFVEREWKGIKDFIPGGPQAISLDIKFNEGHDRFYGLPERINSFLIKDTSTYESTSDGVIR